MEQEIKKENSCKTCRYYLQHYIKHNFRFQTVECGHCLKSNKKIKPVFCSDWEDAEIKTTETKHSLKRTLEKMLKRLEEISTALKNDEEILQIKE